MQILIHNIILGSCFVGNQSDKGLQILVATPLFCYWIFGSMNLASGFLVHRRNREILRSSNLPAMRMMLQTSRSISGTFLIIYCIPCAVLLMAIIYEFANIDVWLNIASIKSSSMLSSETPMWPFLTRAFMEFMLAIICSAWVLGPKITSMFKRQFSKSAAIKAHPASLQSQSLHPTSSSNNMSCRTSNRTTSMASYHSVRQPKFVQSHMKHQNSAIIMKNTPNYSIGRNKTSNNYPAHKYLSPVGPTPFNRSGDETVL